MTILSVLNRSCSRKHRSRVCQYLVNGNDAVAQDLLPDLITNFEAWEKEIFDPSWGLFRQIDDRDGMEVSIGCWVFQN